jgi:hypothetical protein
LGKSFKGGNPLPHSPSTRSRWPRKLLPRLPHHRKDSETLPLSLWRAQSPMDIRD